MSSIKLELDDEETFFFFFANAKTKMQTSCVVTTQLISAFVFRIIDSIIHLIPKSEISTCSDLFWLHSQFCVGHCWESRRQVFSDAAYCVSDGGRFHISGQALRCMILYLGNSFYGEVTI